VEGGGGEGGVVGGGLASLAFRDRTFAGFTVSVTVWSGFILSLGRSAVTLEVVLQWGDSGIIAIFRLV
jgi:hypothetical protein